MDKTYADRIDELRTRSQEVEQVIHIASARLDAIRVRSERMLDAYKAIEQCRAAIHQRIAQEEQGYMIRVCSWCGKHLGIIWIGVAYKGYVVSHGICTECTKIVFNSV